jgi:RNA polymerase sigma-70 factor (ECF subfamily)
MSSITLKACRLAENLVNDDAGEGHLMARADAPTAEIAAKWTAEQRHTRTNQLLASNFEVVFRYAYRLTGCRSSAEDITQEVFLRAFKSIEQLRDPLAERGWLLAITRNEFARWCRLAAAQRATSSDKDVADQVETGEHDLERRDWVQAAMEQLHPEFRAVVLMFYFEQLSYTEIAESLGIPIGTVMSRLSRAKSQLKRSLDDIALPQ